jgi:hypothetical protein
MVSWLRERGPKALPPPTKIPALRAPWRAPPLVAKLFAGAIDLAAGLCLVRAGLPLVQLPLDNAMKNIGARFETENLRIKIKRAGRSGINRLNVGFDV